MPGTGNTLYRGDHFETYGNVTVGQNVNVNSGAIINFGYNVTKETNAGKMGYNVFSTNGLDIVGAGTTTPSIINIYDQLCINNTIINPPSFTNRSTGSKVVLYPSVTSSSADYAIGMMSASMWFGVPQNVLGNYFRWYAGTTNIATLDGLGNLFLGSANIPAGISTELPGTNTPLINLEANFHLSGKNNTYMGAALRLDTRGTTNVFTWWTRQANSTSEIQVASMDVNGTLNLNGAILNSDIYFNNSNSRIQLGPSSSRVIIGSVPGDPGGDVHMYDVPNGVILLGFFRSNNTINIGNGSTTTQINGTLNTPTLYLGGNQAATYSAGTMTYSSPGVINIAPSGALVNVTKDLYVTGNIYTGSNNLLLATQSWVSSQNYQPKLTAASPMTLDTSGNLGIQTGQITSVGVLTQLQIGTNSSPVGNIIQVNADNSAILIDAQSNARLGFVKAFGSSPRLCCSTDSILTFSQANVSNLGVVSQNIVYTDLMTLNTASGIRMNQPVTITSTAPVTLNTTDLTQTTGGALRVEGTSIMHGPLILTGLRNNLQYSYSGVRYFTNAGVGRDTGATYSYYQFVLNKNTHMLLLGNAQIDAVSDRRMKRDIKEIPGDEALKMVSSIPAVRFRYKDCDDERVGFIAQDVVEAGCYEVVNQSTTPSDDFLSLNQTGMIAYLWSAVRRLCDENRRLIARLRDVQSTLERELRSLEKLEGK
ncbi:hypothetical protein HDV00_012757 [Rhizophlyctis rosea]|nr:hypothetical protein HDV00_012757 [Rhizophlyctis rosea]